jgi:hypothetical protein
MIGKALTAAAFLLAGISVPALAQQHSGKASDYSSKKICKLENRNGSRLGGKRTCKTQSEWDQLARESRLTAENIQRGTAPCLVGPNEPGKAAQVCSSFGQ